MENKNNKLYLAIGVFALIAILYFSGALNNLGLFAGTSGGCGMVFAPPTTVGVIVLDNGVPVPNAKIEIKKDDGSLVCIQSIGNQPIYTDIHGIAEGVILPNGGQSGPITGKLHVYLNGQDTGKTFTYGVGSGPVFTLGTGYGSISGNVRDEKGNILPNVDISFLPVSLSDDTWEIWAHRGSGSNYKAIIGIPNSVEFNSPVNYDVIPGDYYIVKFVYGLDGDFYQRILFPSDNNYQNEIIHLGVGQNIQKDIIIPYSELGNPDNSYHWSIDKVFGIKNDGLTFVSKVNGVGNGAIVLRYKVYLDNKLVKEDYVSKTAQDKSKYRPFSSGNFQQGVSFIGQNNPGKLKLELYHFDSGQWILDDSKIYDYNPTSDECTGSQTNCDGKNYYTCSNNKWINNGLVKDQCGVECLSGNTKCNVGYYYTCSDNEWVNQGFNTGGCATTPGGFGECSGNEEKCEGTILYNCINDYWVPYGQQNGKCGYTAPETVTRTQLGNFISQWINGDIDRNTLGSKIQLWINQN